MCNSLRCTPSLMDGFSGIFKKDCKTKKKGEEEEEEELPWFMVILLVELFLISENG